MIILIAIAACLALSFIIPFTIGVIKAIINS